MAAAAGAWVRWCSFLPRHTATGSKRAWLHFTKDTAKKKLVQKTILSELNLLPKVLLRTAAPLQSFTMAPVKTLTAATAATAGFCLLLAIVQVRAAVVVRRCAAGAHPPAGRVGGGAAPAHLPCGRLVAVVGQGGEGGGCVAAAGAAASTAVAGVGSECLQRVLVGQQTCVNYTLVLLVAPLETDSLSCFAYTPVGSAKKHAS